MKMIIESNNLYIIIIIINSLLTDNYYDIFVLESLYEKRKRLYVCVREREGSSMAAIEQNNRRPKRSADVHGRTFREGKKIDIVFNIYAYAWCVYNIYLCVWADPFPQNETTI